MTIQRSELQEVRDNVIESLTRLPDTKILDFLADYRTHSRAYRVFAASADACNYVNRNYFFNSQSEGQTHLDENQWPEREKKFRRKAALEEAGIS
jgi:hypothetical protein